jgi:excisionase family DNA binding protein
VFLVADRSGTTKTASQLDRGHPSSSDGGAAAGRAGLVSSRQVAAALGVSESSVKRWCDHGTLVGVKTPGGHRRFDVATVLRFAREAGHPVRDAAALGAAGGPKSPREVERALLPLLLRGDEEPVCVLLEEAWASGMTTDVIFDDVVAPAFVAIGERWAAGKVQVYEERRACEIVRRAIDALGRRMRRAPRGAPKAIGASLDHDPFSLPSSMAETVLRERGYDARSLGTGLPFETLTRAAASQRPSIFWLAVAHVPEPARFLSEYAAFESRARELGIAVVVGGRALVPGLWERMHFAAHGARMGHLASFAEVMQKPRRAAASFP